MITDVNEAVKQLLITKGDLDPADVDIKFETPDREWSAGVSKPTINIYLYDVRENHQLRGTEWFVTREKNGKATRQKNPNRVDISYIVTVWANDANDEHRLLWHILHVLFRFPELPSEVLSGQLVDQFYPIKTTTAQPDGLFSNPADFWSALDNEIKPSINYVVTVPLDTELAFTSPIVKTKTIEVKPPDTDAEQLIQVGGLVYKAGKPNQGIPEAKVIAKEAGMSAVTDNEGHYSFRRISPGKHTFQVFLSGKQVNETSVTVPGASYDLEVK